MTQRAAGFTLVEVLISTVVLSLIMLTTLSAMRTLGKVDEKVIETTARVDEMRSVSSALRSLLHQAHGGAAGGKSGGTWAGLRQLQGSYFDGGRNAVVWMAPLSGAGGLSGMHYVRLRGQRGELLLDVADYDSRSDEPDWRRRRVSVVLLKDVESFAIAYRPAATEPWQDIFQDETGALPQAVRLRIRTGGRYWPDIVVAPSASVALN